MATASTEYRPATRSAQWEMMVNEYGITLQHDADWTRLSDGAGLFEPFETSLRIEAYCFCKLDGPAIAYDGSARMHFDPASLAGALSGITLTSPDGPALDGHLSFLAKKPDKDLFRDNAASLTLGQAGKPQQWDSDIVFRAVATGGTGLAEGYFAALHHNANAAISAYFYSTATPASDDGKEN
jgi:hypothetical protein